MTKDQRTAIKKYIGKIIEIIDVDEQKSQTRPKPKFATAENMARIREIKAKKERERKLAKLQEEMDKLRTEIASDQQ